MTLGQILVTIGVNTSAVQAGLNAAVQSAAQAGSQAGAAFSQNMGKGLLQLGTRLSVVRYQLGELWGMFSALSGVGIASQFQRQEVAFTQLTGSAEKARTVLRELMELGARTPFDSAQLTKFARTLLAMGIPVDQLTGRVAMMADTVAALGLGTEAVGRLARVMGQVRAGGLKGNNPMQLQELGINIQDVAQLASGKQFGNMQEAMSWFRSMDPKQQEEALAKGLQKKFGGMAESMGMQTFEGVSQNLREQFQLIQLSTGQILLPALMLLGRGLMWVADKFRRVNDATGGWGGLVLLVGALTAALVFQIGPTVAATMAVNRLTAAIARMGVAASVSSMAGGAGGRLSGMGAAFGSFGKVGGIAGIIGRGALALAPLAAELALNHFAGKAAERGDTKTAQRLGGAASGVGWGSLAGSIIGGLIGTFLLPGLGTVAGATWGGLAGGALGGGIGAAVASGKDGGNAGPSFGAAPAAMDANTRATEKLTATMETLGKFVGIGGGDRMRQGLRGAELEVQYHILRSLNAGIG